MTEEELTRLEELGNNATPGPWEWIEDDEEDWELVSGTPEQIMQQQEEAVVYIDLMPALRRDVVKALEEDRAFIAEARTAVPALIAEVRQLKYEREGFTMEVFNLRTELDNYHQAYADSVAEVRRLRGEVGGFISREDALAIALDTMSEPDGE